MSVNTFLFSISLIGDRGELFISTIDMARVELDFLCFRGKLRGSLNSGRGHFELVLYGLEARFYVLNCMNGNLVVGAVVLIDTSHSQKMSIHW